MKDSPAQPHYLGLVTSGLGANLLALILASGSTLVSATLLGASGRGRLAILMVAASIAVVGFSLSLEAGVLHYGNELGVERIYRGLIPLLSFLTLSCACLLGLYAIYWTRTPLDTSLALLYAVGFSAPVCVAPITAVERLRGNHHSATWWSALIVAAQLASGTLTLVWYPTVEAFIVASSLAGLLATATFLGSTRSPKSANRSAAPPPLRGVVKYSLLGHIGVALHMLGMRAPILMAGAILGDSRAGVYSISSSIAELTLLATQAQLPYVLARATSDPGDYSSLKRQLKLCMAATMLLIPLMLSAAIFLSEWLGPEFDDVPLLVLFLAPGSVMLATWRLASYDLTARGMTDLRTWSAGLGTLVTIVCGGALAASMGLPGIAAASSVGYFAMLGAFAAFASVRIGRLERGQE